jgi:plasmid maintenance system antidote protein VapI
VEVTSQTNEYEQLVAKERLILEATEVIHELMVKEGVSRAELARLLHTSRSNVTNMLDGRNMTLRTLAEVARVLGHRLRVEAEVEEPQEPIR